MTTKDRLHPRGGDYPGMSESLLGQRPSRDRFVADRIEGKAVVAHRISHTWLEDWATWYCTPCGVTGLLNGRETHPSYAAMGFVICEACDAPAKVADVIELPASSPKAA